MFAFPVHFVSVQQNGTEWKRELFFICATVIRAHKCLVDAYNFVPMPTANLMFMFRKTPHDDVF